MKNPSHPSILYADDNQDSRDLVSMICQLADIEIVVAGTVEEALQISQSRKFDLFLLDSRFPDGSGLDLCRRLREYAPAAPILFLSGNAYEADVKNGLSAGADEYLIKPFTGNLAETIRRNIEQSRNARLEEKSETIKTTKPACV